MPTLSIQENGSVEQEGYLLLYKNLHHSVNTTWPVKPSLDGDECRLASINVRTGMPQGTQDRSQLEMLIKNVCHSGYHLVEKEEAGR